MIKAVELPRKICKYSHQFQGTHAPPRRPHPSAVNTVATLSLSPLLFTTLLSLVPAFLHSRRPFWLLQMPDESHPHLSTSGLLLGQTSILQAPVSWAPWDNTPDCSLPPHHLPQGGRETYLICLLTEREHSGSFSSCPCARPYSCPMLPKPEWASLILW